MTFEEWYSENSWVLKGDIIEDKIQYSAKCAWDHQQLIIDETMYDLNHAEKACDRLQERIYELEKQLQKVEQAGFYWMNKADSS